MRAEHDVAVRARRERVDLLLGVVEQREHRHVLHAASRCSPRTRRRRVRARRDLPSAPNVNSSPFLPSKALLRPRLLALAFHRAVEALGVERRPWLLARSSMKSRGSP